MAYFAPVALIVSLLRDDVRWVESFGWVLDLVQADKISSVRLSNAKRGKNFMAKSDLKGPTQADAQNQQNERSGK